MPQILSHVSSLRALSSVGSSEIGIVYPDEQQPRSRCILSPYMFIHIPPRVRVHDIAVLLSKNLYFRHAGLRGSTSRKLVILACATMYAMAATHFALAIRSSLPGKINLPSLQNITLDCLESSPVDPHSCRLLDKHAYKQSRLEFNSCNSSALLLVNVRSIVFFYGCVVNVRDC